MDGYHFKYALAANLLLNGNSFAEILPNHTLKFVQNNQMTVEQDDVSGALTYTPQLAVIVVRLRLTTFYILNISPKTAYRELVLYMP